MSRKIRLGLIMEPRRFILNRFTCATTLYLIRGIIDRFDCELITNQREFNFYYHEVDVLLSMEPQFAAPVLNWRGGLLGLGRRKPKLSYVLCSDPHNLQWRQDYFLENNISFMLTLYYAPFRYHFRRIPEERLTHFPWTTPDEWISDEPIVCRAQRTLCCFGATRGPAYTVRNWCRTFDFVEGHSYSGVENKQLTNADYFEWLKGFDAAIAAGADSPEYGLTTPKYFEIAAAGALLFAQITEDLERLGFRDMENCVVFDRTNFEQKARRYLKDPEAMLPVRAAGRQLIRDRHSLSVRLDSLEEHMRARL